MNQPRLVHPLLCLMAIVAAFFWVAVSDADAAPYVAHQHQRSLIGSATSYNPVDLAYDSSGNLYTLEWGSGVFRVAKRNSSGQLVRVWGRSGNGPGEFNTPYGLSVDPSGRIWVGSNVGSRIQIFDANGNLLDTWETASWCASPYSYAFSGSRVFVLCRSDNKVYERDADGDAVASWDTGLTSVFSLAVGSDGMLYVSSTTAIARFPLNGPPRTGLWTGAVSGGNVRGVSGIAPGPSGQIYFTNSTDDYVGELQPDANSGAGEITATWGSAGTGEGLVSTPYSLAKGPGDKIAVGDYSGTIQVFQMGTSAPIKFLDLRGIRMIEPMDVASDSLGRAWVTDRGNAWIRRFQPAATTDNAKFGGGGTQPGMFHLPEGIAIDADDNVYVADYGNGRVQKLNANGAFVAAWSESLTLPARLTVGSDGSIFVLDRADQVVNVFSPSGELLAQWAPLAGIFDLEADREGRIYLSNVSGGSVKVHIFSEEGEQLGFIESPAVGPARFTTAYGLAVSPNGGVHVSGDYYPSRLLRFDREGRLVGFLASPPDGTSSLEIGYGMAVAADGTLFAVDPLNNRVQAYASSAATSLASELLTDYGGNKLLVPSEPEANVEGGF